MQFVFFLHFSCIMNNKCKNNTMLYFVCCILFAFVLHLFCIIFAFCLHLFCILFAFFLHLFCILLVKQKWTTSWLEQLQMSRFLADFVENGAEKPILASDWLLLLMFILICRKYGISSEQKSGRLRG